jgi:hypothetical protein
MPLRDHFHPPLTNRTSWDGLHGGWPMVIVQQLNRVLPERYTAEPQVHLGAQGEVDVAAFGDTVHRSTVPSAPGERDGPVPSAWSPSAPTLTLVTELADVDEYEVRIYDGERARRLVAAVEIVSPSNKDRPESRTQFVTKCAAMLRQEVCVVVVDLVTKSGFNLYAELLDWIGEQDPDLGNDRSPIYAAACRWRREGIGHRLEVWNRRLVVGEALPVLPLWLNEELAIPLDLEASYEQTCRDLRIPSI